MNGSVIITAGGIGKRMGADLPKQFLEVQGKPILLYCLEKFHSYDATLQIVITLPMDWISYWEELVVRVNCQIPHAIVAGGVERFHSIQLALASCQGDYIMVHDGVRPLVSHETIRRCIAALQQSVSVIPVLDVKDSLRLFSADGSKMVNRGDFKLVHTPQCFEAKTLKNAYQTRFQDWITDDASVVELMGIEPYFVESNEENIKITTKSDLAYAQAFLKL